MAVGRSVAAGMSGGGRRSVKVGMSGGVRDVWWRQEVC